MTISKEQARGTEEFRLRAMATNYDRTGHQWDNLDAEVCIAAADRIEQQAARIAQLEKGIKDLEVQQADIFWDDDNPDLGGYGSEQDIAEALAEGMVPADEWAEFSIMRARTLPTRCMRIRLVECADGFRQLEWAWADGEGQ